MCFTGRSEFDDTATLASVVCLLASSFRFATGHLAVVLAGSEAGTLGLSIVLGLFFLKRTLRIAS